jgi:tetratricopeptide (TPR) repeat protein
VACAAAIAASVVLSTLARAQDADGWIGKRVVPRVPGLTLRVDDEPVEQKSKALFIYIVEEVDGRLVRLKAEGARHGGWAPAAQLVPINQAVDFFTTQIRTDARDCFALAMRGLVHFDRHELDLALTDLNGAIGLDAGDPALLCTRGSVWLAKKQPDKAIADFDRVLDVDPKNTVACLGRGKSHAARGAATRAIADFSEAIWLDPLSLDGYFHRGNAWRSKREWAKAIVDYNVAIRLDPEHSKAIFARGVAWEADGKYSQALADYGEALRIDPRSAEAHLACASLLATCPVLTLRDGKKAVASATRACELTEWKDAAALDALAMACASSRDFESAVRWQEKALAFIAGSRDRALGERQAQLGLYRFLSLVIEPDR